MLDRLLHQRHRTLFTALAVTCLGPCVLQAQDAADRPALNRLRVQLDSAPTLAQVSRVELAWNSAAPRAVDRLGDSYIELRRAMLASKQAAFVAAWDGFDQAVRRHPGWPYARLGLALTALEIYVRHYPVPANYDDVASGTHYDGYALQMPRALRAESGFVPAVDWVVASMIASGDYQQPGAIIEALKYIADSTDVIDPRVDLVLARVELQRGNPAQSMRRIGIYLRQGGDAGLAYLEQARALAAMGSPDSAAASYLAGALVQSVAVKDAYQLDINWVASPDELAHFERLSVDSVGAFVAAFWGRRDAQEFQRHGSQLQEHLRRWAYVSQHFIAPDPAYRALFLPYGVDSCPRVARYPTDDGDARAQGGPSPASRLLVDSRAVLYMRYGASLRPAGTVALRDAVGDGNPALAYRYDPGLMSGSNIMSTGNGASVPGTPVVAHRPLEPFMPTTVAPIPFDRDITWVYVVEGQLHEAVPGKCR